VGVTETDIMRGILLACSRGDVRLWRFNVGNFELMDGRRIQSGIAGMSDLMGIGPGGVFLAIEVKTPTNKQRPKEQVMFIEAVRRMGGRAGFATSIAEAEAIIHGT
jgi:hypothetical protein